MLAAAYRGSARMKSTELNNGNSNGILKAKRRLGIMSNPYFFLLLPSSLIYYSNCCRQTIYQNVHTCFLLELASGLVW